MAQFSVIFTELGSCDKLIIHKPQFCFIVQIRRIVKSGGKWWKGSLHKRLDLSYN